MPAIETSGLSKYYGDVRGIEALSFAVEEGEVFGFLGPNGAGKTTTIRTLLGFQSPSEGTATVLGADIDDPKPLRAARARVGYLPSDPAFDENTTGRRFLAYQASLRGDERSDELLFRFGPPMDRKIREYSRGNKQKLAIVIAFMHDPDLVIMDEPTSGLDPLMQERFHEFLRAERKRGTTVFLSSHVLSEVRKVCDRIGIIRDGHLVALEDIESLLDRSGKSVRVRVAERVSETDFELEGAHDVTISGERDRSPRPVATDGGRVATDGGDATIRRGAAVRFTYTGGYNALLSHLLDYTLLDLDIGEAPLEDVFMRFYDTDAEENNDARTARNDSNDSDSTDAGNTETGDDAGSDDGGN